MGQQDVQCSGRHNVVSALFCFFRRLKMGEIINFGSSYRFAVYEHKIQKRKELSAVRMIVLKNQDNRIVAFTGHEAFS